MVTTAKSVKVEEKEVKMEFEEYPVSADTVYKFDTVTIPQGEKREYKPFDFSVFSGMEAEIESVVARYKEVQDNKSKYSSEYLEQVRTEVLIEVGQIKDSYKSKALQQVKDLRQPTVTKVKPSKDEELLNMFKRVNINLIASELMRTSSVEELEALYEANRDNVEVRTMIKARAGHLQRVISKADVRDKASRLFDTIYLYEREISNPESIKELASIEANIVHLFKDPLDYPSGIENGFEGFKIKPVFSK